MARNEGQSSQFVGRDSGSMRVLWTISGYKVGEGAVWGEEEARKLLFKPLDIDATKITFVGQTCHDVIFEKETVKAKEYRPPYQRGINYRSMTQQATGL